MKVKIKRYHGVAVWKWEIDEDVRVLALNTHKFRTVFNYYCKDISTKS